MWQVLEAILPARSAPVLTLAPMNSDSSPTIAVLGLGIIGQAWAHNLEADGLDVRAWNRTPRDFGQQFQNFQSEAAQAVEGADFIFLVVADPPAVESVLDQIEPSLKAGQTLIQSSTISPEWTHRFAERVEKVRERGGMARREEETAGNLAPGPEEGVEDHPLLRDVVGASRADERHVGSEPAKQILTMRFVEEGHGVVRLQIAAREKVALR